MKSATTIAALAAALLAGSAIAGTGISVGNVVVYRVGDGQGLLANTGNAVFIDEYTPTGTLVQSIALNSSVVGGPNLIASGTSTSEGLLTVSPNGRYITVTGYNRALGGTGSLTSSAAATVNRTVAVIDATTGAVTYSTFSDFSDGSSPRSAVTDDGVNLWMAGGSGGVRYATVGSTTSTQIVPTAPQTLTNFRQINIFDGQLYASNDTTSGGNTIALGTVGTGLPTAAGQSYGNLPGINPVAVASTYAFFFADLDASVAGVDTAYVVDDTGTAGIGGILKYSLVGGTWVGNGVVGAAADGYRGITGIVSGGSVQLFATRRGGSAAGGGGELVGVVDASGYNGAFAGTPTLLASAITGATNNTAFRGVGVVVPAPGTLALLGVGGLVAARRRRA